MSEDVRKLNDLPDEPISLPKRRKAVDDKELLIEAIAKYGQNIPPYWTNPKTGSSEFMFAKSVGRLYRADLAWPQKKYMLLAEIDGASLMVRYRRDGMPIAVGRHNQDEDKRKGNLAVALGYRILHYSPTMLKQDPIGCVEVLARALGL